MTGYFLQIFATILFALYFSVVKLYQKREGDDFRNGFLFNAMIGIFTVLIFWTVNQFEFGFTWFSLSMATLSTLCVVGYTLLSFKLLKSGTVALYTMFLMSGGMLVPFFWGIVALGEEITILNAIGIVFMITAMVIMNSEIKSINKWQIVLCIAIFLLNGFTSVIGKLHQTSHYAAVDEVEFIILSSLSKIISRRIRNRFN